jgi:NAD(P)-dependent dehydrogenase (short-subunit alcohol dehydrogenase family)
MDFGLKNKVIVVTEAAKDIGAAIALACGREGAIPVILDRDESGIRKLQEELHQQDISSEAIPLEVTESPDCRRILEDLGRKFVHVDGVVNNFGLNSGCGLEHGSPQRFASDLKSNLIRYYAVSQAMLPFLKRSRGSVVNVTSRIAFTEQGGASAYAAALGAIMEFTSDWAEELGQYGIRVNAVLPAEVTAPHYKERLHRPEKAIEDFRRINATLSLNHQLTEPADIAAMTVFLLSAQSSGITGQALFSGRDYSQPTN